MCCQLSACANLLNENQLVASSEDIFIHCLPVLQICYMIICFSQEYLPIGDMRFGDMRFGYDNLSTC
jgi:hypothetical protein